MVSRIRWQKISGWRRWKRFSPEELERHCQFQRSRLDTYQKLREEVVLYAEAREYVAPKLGQVSKAREDRDDSKDVASKGKGKNPTDIGKDKKTG